jgi:hypothetical protein
MSEPELKPCPCLIARSNRRDYEAGFTAEMFNSCENCPNRRSAGPTDAEINARLQAKKYPNGPEDKAIANYGFTWDTLRDFAKRDDWPLASKLAKALLDVGDVAETAVEQAEYWKLMYQKAKGE